MHKEHIKKNSPSKLKKKSVDLIFLTYRVMVLGLILPFNTCRLNTQSTQYSHVGNYVLIDNSVRGKGQKLKDLWVGIFNHFQFFS